MWIGVAFLAGGVALGAFIFFARDNGPFTVDAWWNALVAPRRSTVLLGLAHALDWLGGPWFGILVLPGVVLIVLAVRRRPWAMLFFVTSGLASAALVQVLKHTFGRARPEDIVVVSDFGSYPSGHVANAATVLLAIYVLFPRRWVGIFAAVWVVLMAFSRTYLAAHWLSDTVGGALVGGSATLMLAAAFGALMVGESQRRRADASPRVPSPG